MSLFKNGDLFVCTSRSKDGSNNAMFVYDGLTQALKASYSPGAAAADGYDGAWLDANGNFWVLRFNTSKIEKWNAAGVQQWIQDASTQPEHVVFDRQGNVFVCSVGAPKLDKYTAAGVLLASYNPAAEDRGVDHMDLHPDGRTVYYTSEGTLIKRWDIKTNVQLADFVTIPNCNVAYAIRRVVADGSYLVVVGLGTGFGSSGWVSRISSTGAWMRNYIFAEYDGHFGLDVDADGQHFWFGATTFTSPKVAVAVKVNLATGAKIAEVRPGVTMQSFDGVVINVVKTKMPMLRVF